MAGKKRFVLVIHDDFDKEMCTSIRYRTEEEAIQGLHKAVADFFHEYSRKAVEDLSDHVYHFTNHIVECETEGYKTSFRIDYVPDHLPAEERRKRQKEEKKEENL